MQVIIMSYSLHDQRNRFLEGCKSWNMKSRYWKNSWLCKSRLMITKKATEKDQL